MNQEPLYMGLWGEPASLPSEARLSDPTQPTQPTRPVIAPSQRMRVVHGNGPNDATCGGCAHLLRDKHHDSQYYKCEKFGLTRGHGTDWRMKYAACGLFSPRRRDQEGLYPIKRRTEVPCQNAGCNEMCRAYVYYPNRPFYAHHPIVVDIYGHKMTQSHAVRCTIDWDGQLTVRSKTR